MANVPKGGRSIFIGNIPYGLTEEQIVHTFSTVGQVLNFRLIYDSETGRPRGYGFAEFADPDSAASAVRNLNGYEIMGRELRVDFSKEGDKDQDPTQNPNMHPLPPQIAPPNGYPQQQQQMPQFQAQQTQQQQQQGPMTTALPQLPPGVDLPPGLTSPDAISQTLKTLAPPQLLDVLSQMKGLVMGDPQRATELLTQAPQLAYAIFQALLLMGLVDPSVLTSLIETGSGQAPPLQPPPQQPQQTPGPQQMYPQAQQQSYQPQQPPPPPPPLHQQQQPPAQAQHFPQYPGMQGLMGGPTPPVHAQPYQPPPQMQQHLAQHPTPQPPQQQQQQQAPPPQTAQNPQHEELLKQVLAMTPQQIDSLPLQERQQIMSLRQQLMGRY